MPVIAATATGFPPHYYSQEELTNALRDLWIERGLNPQRLERFHASVNVGGRHLALPREQYYELETFGASNDAWIGAALDLSEQTVQTLCDRAGIAPEELNAFFSTTVTGIAVPSLEARLMNRLPLSRHLKRTPLFGLGCVAGAAGIARASDYLRGHPNDAAVLLAVELCSLTLQHNDVSVAAIISSGLFGDGAGAVLLVGDEHPLARQSGRPQVVATQSVFFPDTERVMGWDVTESGLKIVLSAEVPALAGPPLRDAVAAFLSEHGLSLQDIGVWLAHPGGPKVIDEMETHLGLTPGTLDASRRSLQEKGNLSSVSVLLILDEFLQQPPPPPGSYGVLLAMGPAFCAELVLLRF